MLKCKESISVILPAYNERANIEAMIKQVLQILPELSDKWEIIVVDDGSTDGTAEIVKKYTLRIANISSIHHLYNKGYGAAIGSGISHAKEDLVFFCDSDLQFDIRELNKLLPWIGNFDIVIGYRIKRHDPLHRRIYAFFWNLFVKLILGLKVKDINCAFKIFRRDVFDNITIETEGAAINAEILIQAVKHGCKIKEIPVSHFPRKNGKQTGSNPKVIFKAFMEIIKLYRRLKTI